MPVPSRVAALLACALLASGCGADAKPALPRATAVHTESVPLPVVPDEGVIVDAAGVATFRSLDGRVVVPVAGYRLRDGIVTGSGTWLAAADGSTWFVDVRERRLVRRPLGYESRDGAVLLPRLPRAERTGHWRWALPGPSGRLLAQWSGECEVPTAYVVERGRLRQVGPEGRSVNAFARGWTRSGMPVVEFPDAACGEGLSGPGLYVETHPGRYRLLVRAEQGAYYRLPA